jgi:undecaprenyl-diphosphatase
MAQWLNTVFAGLDGGVFRALNSINCEFLNVFCKIFSYIGEKGIPLIIIGLILCCFVKTRKIGLGILFGIAVGAVFTNIVIKNVVARPRPYVSSTEFSDFWLLAGGNIEGEYSFPSGHTTATTAFAVAVFMACDKKWSWSVLFGALIMGFCRIYLVVHYFTDVIAGLIVGSVAGVIGFFLVKLVYDLLEKYKDKKICDLALNWSVTYLFKKGNAKKK